MPEKHYPSLSSDYFRSVWSREQEDRGRYVSLSERNRLSPCFEYVLSK